MNTQTKAKLAILTDTVIANKELGMDRLRQAKNEAGNPSNENNFVYIIDSLIGAFNQSNDENSSQNLSSQDLESAVHILEHDQSTDVRVAGRILRWAARNRGFTLS